MKDTTTGKTPPEVAERSKQGGDERERHPHAKPWVWTERMLAALENGVKGGKSLLCGAGVVHHGYSPCRRLPVPMWKPLTGEPDAGDPHVRFGGRGDLTGPPYPYHRAAAALWCAFG